MSGNKCIPTEGTVDLVRLLHEAKDQQYPLSNEMVAAINDAVAGLRSENEHKSLRGKRRAYAILARCILASTENEDDVKKFEGNKACIPVLDALIGYDAEGNSVEPPEGREQVDIQIPDERDLDPIRLMHLYSLCTECDEERQQYLIGLFKKDPEQLEPEELVYVDKYLRRRGLLDKPDKNEVT